MFEGHTNLVFVSILNFMADLKIAFCRFLAVSLVVPLIGLFFKLKIVPHVLKCQITFYEANLNIFRYTFD